MQNEMNPLVSVIVPTYKRPKSIKKAIENIKNQTYKNLEIIVINDNGVENNKFREETYLEVEKYIKNNEIKYIELNNNKGGALARNEGIKLATGKYMSFFDDDDEYYSQKIELQLNFFEKNKNSKLAFVKSEMDIVSNDKIISTTDTSKYFLGNDLLKNHLMNLHGVVGTTSFLFNSSILKKIGGFEEVSIRQEYMLILKILSEGYEGIYLGKNLVTLNIEGESITRSKDENKVKSMKMVLEKRLSYPNLNRKEKKQILKDHYLDLVEWYCVYKKFKCVKYSILSLELKRTKLIRLLKLNFKNLFNDFYLEIRRKIKGF